MADPLTLAATIVTLVGALATVSQSCHNIWERYKHAQHHLISLDVECSALTTSLQAVKQIIIAKSSDFQNMIRSQEDNTLFDDLTTTLNSCSIVINHLNEQIAKLYHATDSKRWFTFSGRAKYVWNEDAIRTLLDRTRGLTGAVNLILNTLQTQSLVNVYQAVQKRHQMVQTVEQSARALQLEDDSKSTFFLPNKEEDPAQTAEDANHLDILMKSPAYKKAFMKWLKEPTSKEDETINSDDNLRGSSGESLSDSIVSELDSPDTTGSLNEESVENDSVPTSISTSSNQVATEQSAPQTRDNGKARAVEPATGPSLSHSQSRADMTARLVNDTLGPARQNTNVIPAETQPGRWKQFLQKANGRGKAPEKPPVNQGPYVPPTSASTESQPVSAVQSAPVYGPTPEVRPTQQATPPVSPEMSIPIRQPPPVPQTAQVQRPVAGSELDRNAATPTNRTTSSHRIADILTSVAGSSGPWDGETSTLVEPEEEQGPPAYSAHDPTSAQVASGAQAATNRDALPEAAQRSSSNPAVEVAAIASAPSNSRADPAPPKPKHWWSFGLGKSESSDANDAEKQAEKQARADEDAKARITKLQSRLSEIDGDLQVLREVQQLITDRVAAKKNYRAIRACKRKIKSYEKELAELNDGDVHRTALTQSALELRDGGMDGFEGESDEDDSDSRTEAASRSGSARDVPTLGPEYRRPDGRANSAAVIAQLARQRSNAPSVSSRSSESGSSDMQQVTAARHGRYAPHRASSTTSSTTRFGDMMRDADANAPEQARNAISNAQLLIASSRKGSQLLKTYEEARRAGRLPEAPESSTRKDGKPLSKHKARKAARRELVMGVLESARQQQQEQSQQRQPR